VAASKDAYVAAGSGGFPVSENGSGGPVRSLRRGVLVRPGGVERKDGWGIVMFAGLVWRTLLFFGLTAGYALLAALPYLA
jgi:hypothetical protein